MRNQVLNPKHLILLFVTVLLTYGVEGISYGEVCEAGDILAPGESCTYPGTDVEFSVLNNGSGQFLFVTSGNSITIRNTVINGVSYTLVANKLASGSWEIEEIAGSTAPAPINTAPTFTDGASTTRTVAENTAAEVNIGTAIAATDADNDTLTYTLGGTDAASFSIESTTGQLQTKAALDYETKTSYSVTVSVADGNGGSDSITVTINVTDVNETPANNAPVFGEGDSITITMVLPPKGNTEGDYDVGNPLFATDADGDIVIYSLSGTDADLFHTYVFGKTVNGQIQSYAQLTTRGWSLHDANKSSFTVIVTASDRNGSADSITVTINVTNETPVNNAPVFADGTSTTRSIAENTATNVNIGTAIAATDADNDTLTYTLGGTDAASFGINSSTGQLQTKATLDYETKTTYTVTVTVSDSSLTDTITVTISVTDVAETPTTGVTSPEVCQVGDVLDPGESCTYPGTNTEFSVLSDGRGQFGFFTSGSSLNIKNTVINGQSYTLVANKLTSGSWKIEEVADSTETPGTTNTAPTFTDGASTTRSIAENTAAGRHIGTPVAATDADNDTLTYTLGGTDAASFGIDATTGQLKTKAALDYETKTTYTVTVTVSDGNLTDTITVTINITDVADSPGVSRFTPVCDRTPQVRDGIVAAVLGVNDCSDVTEAHLAAITVLNFNSTNITVLKSGDFGGLSALYELRVERNQLRTLPSDIFSGLSSLRHLFLGNNRLTHLPADVFSGLSALQHIYLNQNQLGSLPADVFSGLTSLIQINLHTNLLTNLPADVFSGLPSLIQIYLRNNRLTNLSPRLFSGLSSLQSLFLDKNRLTTLPAGVFSGLPSLTKLLLNDNQISSLSREMFRGLTTSTWLWLQGNTIDPLPLTISLEKVGVNQFKATVPAGAPFTITIPISVVNGAISGGVSTLTIPQGSVESGRITVTRIAGTTAAVTVDIGVLPGLPANHQGYQLVKPTDPPLEIISGPGNSAPVFTEGTSTTRSIAENTAAGIHIGAPVAATDADNDTLTYTLDGTDAASFGIDATTGQLKTKAALDYETKRSYTVTVTVSDGTLTDSITVTINITDVAETPTNRGPVFTDGTSTTRSIAENTAAGIHIGAPVAATDADNDTLIYTLGGTDAASFGIDATTGQLKTKAALDYETKRSYAVTVTVSDGSLTDTITVTINITDVDESLTDTGVCKVGDILKPGESCTYPGTEATFSVLNNGHARWNIPGLPSWLAWANQVSVGGSLSFTATINDDDYHFVAAEVPNDSWEIKEIGDSRAEQPETPEQQEQPGNTGATPTLSASTTAPLTEATLNESIVTLTLNGAIYEDSTLKVRDAVTVSTSISGVTVDWWDIDEVSDTKVAVELTFDGTDFDTNSTITFTVGAGAIANYDGAALTEQVSVAAATESVVASTTAPLTEATLDESVVTLTLSGRNFEQFNSRIRGAVSVSGISSVTIRSFDIDRVSDTQVTIELTFDGDISTDSTLTFTVGPGAIADYDGPALTAQVSVSASTEAPTVTDPSQQPEQPGGGGGTPTLRPSTTTSLTETTLHESVVTLTLNGGTYVDSSFSVARAISVSGIDGVTFNTWDVDDISDTVVTVELTFNGDFDTNSTLTFTVGAGAIEDYNGAALTAQVPVSGGPESIVASTDTPLTEATLNESVVTLTLSGRIYEDSSFSVARAINVSGIDGVTFNTWDVDDISDTVVTVELTFNGDFDTNSTLTFTVGADAIEDYNGAALTAQLPVTSGTESLVASTTAPLTEATLDESVVTLTLSGRVYEDSSYTVGRAITVSGIDGVTFQTWDVDRVSDTVVTVELTFNGDFDANATLTFTVGADAIAGYGGSAFTAQLPVTASTESLVASTTAPLTESTLDESVVTLTLSGRNYVQWIRRGAVTVSGINGVTFDDFFDLDRVSDTVVTVELTFNGNIQTDSTLTFTVSPEAIVGYSGPALTAEIPVTAGLEADANNDGVVNTQDLVLVASNYGKTGTNSADINGDGVVNIDDLTTVAGALDSAGAAPSAHPQALETFTAADIKLWLSHARQRNFTDPTALKGILFLEQLLAALIPKETVLLPNYPNPFNPETWIPYHLATDADVTLTIYNMDGQVVRQFALGHQAAGRYQSRSRAIYWNGKNEFGEQVASGVYFYHLSADRSGLSVPYRSDFSATRKMLILK